jgi:hypothetical protein
MECTSQWGKVAPRLNFQEVAQNELVMHAIAEPLPEGLAPELLVWEYGRERHGKSQQKMLQNSQY